MSDRNLRTAQWATENGYLPARPERLEGLMADKQIHPNTRVRVNRLNAIYSYVADNPGKLGDEIAGYLQVNTHTILMYCLDLEDIGLIEATEDQKNGAPKRYYTTALIF